MPEMMMPPPEAVKISENVYRIEQGFVRCFLFIGNEKALLVDAGFGGEASLKELIASLTDKPVQLVLTHADPDHNGYLAEFDKAYMHEAEFAACAEIAQDAGTELIALKEGDLIDIGGRTFEVLHVPGHTPGSLAFLDRENRMIVTGDMVSSMMPVFLFGPGRDYDTYLSSMEKLAEMKDAFDEIYPSHGAFPLTAEYADKMVAAAKKYGAGELAAQDPPMPLPAKMYMDGDVGFYF